MIAVSLTVKALLLLYVPSCLTFKDSTFCPCSVFMCLVWISGQTAITSVHIIDWSV